MDVREQTGTFPMYIARAILEQIVEMHIDLGCLRAAVYGHRTGGPPLVLSTAVRTNVCRPFSDALVNLTAAEPVTPLEV